ncbi:MBL fold metallo-hydrolase [Actinotalea sp. M2MS4P-6]|uniref:MBL fold metallo-hydrolase n=1 Tax=Actinotalea sp. M2MS4P-6 TaxID=2983762 RepID=UPI0021E4D56A|nr:MBL fold metallo-hydrolase [Actinotalea sp. M2MS4P-6]MCV2394625.1 MBL fold metallo-hydrolase [Actinotalea sp. M2MS4P-6]
MRLTVWGHSCISIDTGDGRLVVDPGSFSRADAALEDAGTVLITHEHADHVVPEHLVAVLEARPDLAVHAPVEVLELLMEHGAPGARLHAVSVGDRPAVAGTDVLVGGGTHAEIHPDVPRPANVGYLIGTVWHPGDSLDLPPGDAEVLLLPAAAPWLKLAEAIDFCRAVAPRVAVPIHDAILSDPGRALADRLLSGLGRAGEYRRLAPGESLEV